MLEQGHRAPVINGPLLLPFRACSFRMMRPAAQGPSFILVQTASEDVAAGLERKSVSVLIGWKPGKKPLPEHIFVVFR